MFRVARRDLVLMMLIGMMMALYQVCYFYLEKFSEPQVPADLLHHNCIVYTRQSTGNEWHFRGTTVTVSGNLQVNNSMALREAVLANIGIGTSPIWSFSDELQNQSVKVILAEYEPEPIPIQVVYRRGRFQSAKVKCSIDFLGHEFKAGPSWQPTSLLE